MEILIDLVLVKNIQDIRVFSGKVNEKNKEIVKLKLISEEKKIIEYLKTLKKAGLIKSIFRPKNKTMKNDLAELVKIKKKIKNSLEKINKVI